MIMMFGILYSESLVLLYQCFLFSMDSVNLFFLFLFLREQAIHGRICYAFENMVAISSLVNVRGRGGGVNPNL